MKFTSFHFYNHFNIGTYCVVFPAQTRLFFCLFCFDVYISDLFVWVTEDKQKLGFWTLSAYLVELMEEIPAE